MPSMGKGFEITARGRVVVQDRSTNRKAVCRFLSFLSDALL